ncbi:MAG TPA: class I SAM-dependent methyltransferase [Thermoanaerobaculia bacterium]|nr:class I SAM-dependent methyltransferase [Thermoanaerobaculia bacterium]
MGEGGQGGEGPFDALAAEYDAYFTTTPLGTHLREAVWRRLDARFSPGDRVLELACGTGEDAVHLARRGVRVTATDPSPGMLEEARRKVASAELDGSIVFHQLAAEELAAAADALPGPFNGAFSDFGGPNCFADLGAVARALARRLRPGAPVLLCVMGPLVPWEWIWYLGQGDPKKAFRRLRPGGLAWRGMTVRYPSIRALRRAFAPGFRTLRTGAVGAFLPPTYTEEWIRRHPRLLAALSRWERRLERMPPLPWLADHYLIEMERRAT